METFSMSRKEVPRAGLLKAALAGRITNAQGARAVGVSVRQFRRLKKRCRERGTRGLLHALRGRPGNRRLAPQAREQIAGLMTMTYAGFNDVHLTEKLREVHQLVVSRSSVRQVRTSEIRLGASFQTNTLRVSPGVIFAAALNLLRPREFSDLPHRL